MKTIYLSSTERFIVDDEDYNRVNKYSWSLVKKRGKPVIIMTRIGREFPTIGRFLLNVSNHLTVDHIDRDIFNNQKSNLRVATYEQQNWNRGLNRNNKSGYKGVSHVKGRGWLAQISPNGKYIYLGYHATKEQAAKIYNEAALKHFGEFAYLNVIKEQE